MNIVSFCLFGNDPKYVNGAIQNAKDVPEKYPFFEARFYVDVDHPAIPRLAAAGAQIYEVTEPFDRRKFDRLAAIWEIEEDGIVLIRDTDPRITDREVAAVQTWIRSGLAMHTMRDHPNHLEAMMGGMWGCRRREFRRILGQPDLRRRAQDWLAKQPSNLPTDSDQPFLRDQVWPVFVGHSVMHDDYLRLPGSIKFSVPARGNTFVGEVFEANGTPRAGDRESRAPAP